MNGCLGVHNLHDDIKVVAETEVQLGERVENVIKKFVQHGLTLNYSKCVVGVDEMFIGEVLTINGLKVSSEKVKCVVEAPRPTSKFEMRSFWEWLILSKLIRNFASIL